MYLLLIILSAVCCAIAELLETKYSDTIFSLKRSKFWSPENTGKTILGFIPVNAEQVFSIGTLLFLILAIAFSYVKIFPFEIIPSGWKIITCIILYIVSYNISYRKFLIKSKKW